MSLGIPALEPAAMFRLLRFLAPEPSARPARPARRAPGPPVAPASQRVAHSNARETGDWSQVRSPERPQDQVLTELARRWVDSLPPPVRPKALLERFPRIANRLALCWSDPALAGPLLNDLLVDQRGSRQGFPAAVAADLKRLHAHFSSRMVAAPTSEAWSPSAMAVVDR